MEAIRSRFLLGETGEEREALEAILAREEFAGYRGPDADPGQNLLLHWLERLLEAFSGLFPDIDMAPSSEDAVSYGIVIFGFLALCAFATALFRLLWAERSAGRRRTAARTEELEQAPAGLLERASAAAAEGEYREATRLTFLALLLGFQRMGLLRVEQWKTNWEYAEELSAKDNRWLPLFRESALRFDSVWYGGRTIGAAEYEEWAVRVWSAVATEEGDAA